MANIYARGSTVQLTVPGRRTGQPRSLPLNLLIEDSRRYPIVARFFDARPGDSVERFAADTDKKPVFEILPG